MRRKSLRGGASLQLGNTHNVSDDFSDGNGFESQERTNPENLRYSEDDVEVQQIPISQIDFPDGSDFNESASFKDSQGDEVEVRKDPDTGEIEATKYYNFGSGKDLLDQYASRSGVKEMHPEIFEDETKRYGLETRFVSKLNDVLQDNLRQEARNQRDDDKFVTAEVDFGDYYPSDEGLRYLINTTFYPGEDGDYHGNTFRDILDTGEDVVVGSDRYYPELEEFLKDTAQKTT